MRNCPHCLNTAVIEDGYCGHCRQTTMPPLNVKETAAVAGAAHGSAIHGATYHELNEANAKLCAENAALLEVKGWAQAMLTALNVGDVKSGSPLHLKLREVMIAYRADTDESPNDQAQRRRE